jgi:flagellar biosynthesis/type III secretory pathway protein FliH
LSDVEDAELRRRLLTGLVALLSEEELITMIEQLIEEEELLTDTPYLRRIREKSRQEAIAEGLAEGQAKGLAEGQAKGLTEGIRISRRQDILNVLIWRFDPPVSLFQQVEKTLSSITDADTLAMLLKAATQAKEFADFQAALRTN